MEHPEWSAKLRWIYWKLRNARKWDGAERRRYYRLIAIEKQRIIETGIDQEEIRIYCRFLANPLNQRAERRFVVLKSLINSK